MGIIVPQDLHTAHSHINVMLLKTKKSITNRMLMCCIAMWQTYYLLVVSEFINSIALGWGGDAQRTLCSLVLWLGIFMAFINGANCRPNHTAMTVLFIYVCKILSKSI